MSGSRGILLLGIVVFLHGVLGAGELAPGLHERTIKVSEHEWTYHIQVPLQVKEGKALPVVLVLHGAGGNGKLYLERNGWAALADKEGFIAVAPDGQTARGEGEPNFLKNPRLWNSGQLHPSSPRAKIDDAAFFNALLDEVATLAPVDAKRVYAAGHSNGAGMAFRLGVLLNNRLAAIAPVASHFWNRDTKPEKPLPTLFIIGTDDPLVPLEGGTRQLPWAKQPQPMPPVKLTLTSWAKQMGCETEPKVISENGRVKITEYPGPVPFRAVYIEGHGHNWPGGREGGLPGKMMGANGAGYDATKEIWAFFKPVVRE